MYMCVLTYVHIHICVYMHIHMSVYKLPVQSVPLKNPVRTACKQWLSFELESDFSFSTFKLQWQLFCSSTLCFEVA